jgi:hypothetical protein
MNRNGNTLRLTNLTFPIDLRAQKAVVSSTGLVYVSHIHLQTGNFRLYNLSLNRGHFLRRVVKSLDLSLFLQHVAKLVFDVLETDS